LVDEFDNLTEDRCDPSFVAESQGIFELLLQTNKILVNKQDISSLLQSENIQLEHIVRIEGIQN